MSKTLQLYILKKFYLKIQTLRKFFALTIILLFFSVAEQIDGWERKDVDLNEAIHPCSYQSGSPLIVFRFFSITLKTGSATFFISSPFKLGLSLVEERISQESHQLHKMTCFWHHHHHHHNQQGCHLPFSIYPFFSGKGSNTQLRQKPSRDEVKNFRLNTFYFTFFALLQKIVVNIFLRERKKTADPQKAIFS